MIDIYSLIKKYNLEIKTLKKREKVFNNYSYYEKVCFILKGKIKEILLSDKGSETVLSVYRTHDFCGNFSFLLKNDRDSFAISLTNTQIVEIDYYLFQKILNENIEFLLYFTKKLYKLNLMLVQRYSNFTSMNASKRFITYIINFCNYNETNIIPIGLEEIGKSIKATRQTIYKILRELEKQNLVEKQFKCLLIKDINSLKKLL